MHPEREFNLRELPLLATRPARTLSKSSPSPATYTDTGSDLSSSSVTTPDQFHSPTSISSHMTPLTMTTQTSEYSNASLRSPVSPASVTTSPHATTAIPSAPAQPSVYDWKMPAFSNLALFPQSTDGFDPRQLWANAQAYGGYTQDSAGQSPGSYEQAMLMDVQSVQTDPWDKFLYNTLR